MPSNYARLNSLATATLFVSSCIGILGTAAAAKPAPLMAMVGGYSSAPVTDPGVIAAAKFGVAHLRRPGARLARVDDAERQVVAGTNYRMRVTLTDRTRWGFQVFRPLRGPMVAGGAELLPSASRRH
ncbi:MAG: hypothetical protein JWO25_347 [Alphaproteobacteria bacterium]|nr:hypothetical protein [Alphaproteobacteria bacterium]